MKNVTKEEFINCSMWKIVESFSSKGISMIVSIVLARLLMPEDYGLIALTSVFTNLSDILIDGGFSTALIRKESVEDDDFSSVLYVSIGMATLLYSILFFVAPFVSSYYNSPKLTYILKVMGLTFFVQAFNSSRNAIVSRNMQYQLLCYSNVIGSIISGLAGIIAAYSGLGVWSLVIQRLSQQLIVTVILLLKVNLKFSFSFNLSKIKGMLVFCSGVVGSSLLNYVGSSLYSITIGKKYSVSSLGYYEKGSQLPMQFSLYTFGAMSSVLLPTISSCQSDLERVKQIVRKTVRMTTFLIMPLMVGMSLVSRELIILLFTEKWVFCTDIMVFSCLYYLATPFMLINVQIFFALGKSYLRVKSEIVRIVLLFLGMFFSVFLLDCSITQLSFVGAVIAVLVAFFTYLDIKKLIRYSFSEVFEDMWKPIISTTFMASVILIFFKRFGNTLCSNVLRLVIKVGLGVLSYSLIAVVLKDGSFMELLGLLFKTRGKKNV